MQGFDYIIIGAGSSGCVLANRLSADPANRVLLLEAGGSNDSPFIRMAGGFIKIMGKPDYFWSFPVAKQDGRRPERHGYGKGLGGSSAINGTWYLRGQPADFDGWRDAGLAGWGWDEIERQYLWLEDYRAPGADPSRGRGGSLQVTQSTYKSPVYDAMVAACEQTGLEPLSDICTPGRQGVGRTQYTVDRKGHRASSYTAFVEPIRNRPNLVIETGVTVKTILIEDGRAAAVLCEQDGEDRRFDAAGEIVVSAGVYGSPALLQRSGIGDPAVLTGLGIPMAAELPAVGANLCDHQKLGISYDLKNDPGTNREYFGWRLYRNAARYFLAGSGPLARVGMPWTALWSSGRKDWPDFQLAGAAFAMRTVKEMVESPGSPLTPNPGITFSGYHLRPKSRGSVAITSADPAEMPLVTLDLLAEQSDVDNALLLLAKLREVAAAPALSRYVGNERAPGADLTDRDELVPLLRQMLDPGLHGTGTCSMGTDAATSVTDARCRVHGIKGLRVVDCSIMPSPVSGNTNGPAMAVGARAAEMILEDSRN